MPPRYPPVRPDPTTAAKVYSSHRRVVAHLAEQVAQDGDGPFFAQGFVPVAALGGLDTSWATALAGATGEDAQGVAGHLFKGVVAAFGDANPTGIAVVDEDGRHTRLTVHGDGEPPDVPPVAHREERQQPDKGVLRRVQGAQELDEARLGVTLRSRWQRGQGEPEAACLELRRGQVEGEDAHLMHVGDSYLLVQ